jgi:hypothetical protein
MAKANIKNTRHHRGVAGWQFRGSRRLGQAAHREGLITERDFVTGFHRNEARISEFYRG